MINILWTFDRIHTRKWVLTYLSLFFLLQKMLICTSFFGFVIKIFNGSQNNWSHFHHIHYLPFWRAPRPSLCHPLIGIGGHKVGLRPRTLQCEAALLSLCVDEDILWRVGWQLKMKKWTEKQKLTKGELASLRGGAEGEAWDRKDLEK